MNHCLNKLLFTIFFMLNFLSCHADDEIQKRTKLTDLITSSAAQEICKSYNLEVIGIGGSTLDGVRFIDISFGVDKTFSIEEARVLIVCCEEILLRTINSYSQIRPYLVEFPFPVTRGTVSITSKNPPKNAPDIVSHFGIAKGMIYYDATNEKTNFVKIHSEPYEHALQVLRKNLQKYTTKES